MFGRAHVYDPTPSDDLFIHELYIVLYFRSTQTYNIFDLNTYILNYFSENFRYVVAAAADDTGKLFGRTSVNRVQQ